MAIKAGQNSPAALSTVYQALAGLIASSMRPMAA